MDEIITWQCTDCGHVFHATSEECDCPRCDSGNAVPIGF